MRFFFAKTLGVRCVWSLLLPLALLSCSSEPEVKYGPLDGLRGKKFPQVTGGAPTDGGFGGADGGVDCTGAQGLTFTSDIFPKMRGADKGGKWGCTSANCHGGPTPPAINGDNPGQAFEQLVQYVESGRPYIKAGSTNPDESRIVCRSAGICADQKPPMPSDVTLRLSGDDLLLVERWIRCTAAAK